MLASLILAAGATTPAPRPIDVESLLGEMADLRRLAHRSDPAYHYRQWTSYDRNMAQNPYANDDFGKFLRSEGNEQVMAEVKGPGALVRLWSANPAGTLRFYFDGETTPRLAVDMADLLTGKNPLFPAPFAYVAARGANLYFPLPFAKGLKVTWDGGGKIPNSGLYYAVGIREYAPGSRVTSFTLDAAAKAKPEMARVAKALFPKIPPIPIVTDEEAILPVSFGDTVEPGGIVARDFTSLGSAMGEGGELSDLRIGLKVHDAANLAWGDPRRTHNILRRLHLVMSFDGETTVDAPLGDFFGSAAGITPFESLPISVQNDGTMLARWPMPFRKRAKVWIENGNAFPVEIAVSVRSIDRPFTPGTYLFHAGWNAQARRTRPMYDFILADLKGEGRYVGSSMLISNPSSAWWGEGDEKVRVDGEPFPSLFGTGTEDYFGYAWGDPTPFSEPYHAQPPTPNRGNLGQTQNARYHLFDDVPFRSALRFDMEAWHWADVVCTYATTAYWYASPGSQGHGSTDFALVPDAPLPQPVKGAIEAENLRWTVTNGIAETQSGFAALSGDRQFWWRQPEVGATATATIPVASAGRYELFANLGHARDYGRFRVIVNRSVAKEIDLYQPDLEWRRESLGTFDLPAGGATVRFEALTANPASVRGANMLGVDYFLLEKRG